MKPSQLAQIILRLFTLSWLLHGINLAATAIAMHGQGMPEPTQLVPAAVALALAAAVWALAPAIGRFIASSDKEQPNPVPAVSFQQLLYAMFVGIGLYWGLSSVGVLINSLHFYLVLQADPKSIPAGMQLSPYEVSKGVVTFASAICLTLSAPHWSRRLSNK